MTPSIRIGFLVLILAQTAHSLEETWFGFYHFLPPFQALAVAPGLDLLAFAVVNVAIVSFGFWCYLARVRPAAPTARALVWGWTIVELANGVGHPLWALLAGSYIPGTITAPLLLITSAFLATRLMRPIRPTP